MPTYLKYKYIFSSYQIKVESGIFFSWARSIQGKNVGSSSQLLIVISVNLKETPVLDKFDKNCNDKAFEQLFSIIQK